MPDFRVRARVALPVAAVATQAAVPMAVAVRLAPHEMKVFSAARVAAAVRRAVPAVVPQAALQASRAEVLQVAHRVVNRVAAEQALQDP